MRNTRMKAMAALATLSMTASGVMIASGGTASGAAAVKFGTMASPCGKKSGTLTTPANTPGVTSSSIKIGYGDDASLQNTNISMGHAIKAMIAWCNKQGGINGRTLVGDYHDAGIFNATSAINAAVNNHDFMLVGEGWADDGATEATRLAADLVSVPGFTASAAAQNAYEMYQANPNPSDQFNAEMAVAGKALLGAAAVAQVCAYRQDNLPGAAALAQTTKQEYSFPNFGWTFRNANGTPKTGIPSGVNNNLGCDQNVGYLDYMSNPGNITAASQGFQQYGAKVLTYQATDGPTLTNLLTANHASGYNPIVFAGTTAYGPKLAAWNTKGYGDNVYATLAIQPIEATAVPAVKSFASIVAKADQTSVAEQAVASFLLFGQAAKSCGNDLTRQCMVNYLGNPANFTSGGGWSAGGLMAPSNPATNTPSACVILMHLKKTKWVQAYPTKVGTFACAKSSMVDTHAILGDLQGGTAFAPTRGVTLNLSDHFTQDLSKGQTVLVPKSSNLNPVPVS